MKTNFLGLALMLAAQFASASGPEGLSYKWTKVDPQYLKIQQNDYVAEIAMEDGLTKYVQMFKVIYRTPEEKKLLERYMKENPKKDPDYTPPGLGFAVYLGHAEYHQGMFGEEGDPYRAPWSVVFIPNLDWDIYDFAAEVCDGSGAMFNHAGYHNDTSISTGIKSDKEISPAPDFCPWQPRLSRVTFNGKEIWNNETGSKR